MWYTLLCKSLSADINQSLCFVGEKLDAFFSENKTSISSDICMQSFRKKWDSPKKKNSQRAEKPLGFFLRGLYLYTGHFTTQIFWLPERKKIARK